MMNSSLNSFRLEGDIVVVEDDPLLRRLMGDILADLGDTCHSFQNCDDALVYLLQSGGCAAVVADHDVPGQLHGAEFLGMVADKWPGTPTVLMSGFALEDIPVKPGIVCLAKPWSAESLIKALGSFAAPVTDG
ncbi:response regulator [Pseudomonas eucalypticola]|uniref:Response regulator n=1 Tax=Pseudomonas eucalypticola TaxID=2599595 RepID=A0A7D5H510_9PSED|nr:response regulator [Pseudomonas eucalypticola]QKZ04189.1 response regulator [Pseudomonas eucalypticola]